MNFDLITEYLKVKPTISFAYIFGSVITPYYIPGKSDVDIGILGDQEFTFYELQEMAQDISELLPDHPQIDLIDLMMDAPVLINQIIETGKPLFIKDDLIHDLFYCTQWSKYIDHVEWAKQFDEELKKGVITNKSSI